MNYAYAPHPCDNGFEVDFEYAIVALDGILEWCAQNNCTVYEFRNNSVVFEQRDDALLCYLRFG